MKNILILFLAAMILSSAACKKDEPLIENEGAGYDCVNGNCEQKSTGADYATLAECQNACAGNNTNPCFHGIAPGTYRATFGRIDPVVSCSYYHSYWLDTSYASLDTIYVIINSSQVGDSIGAVIAKAGNSCGKYYSNPSFPSDTYSANYKLNSDYWTALICNPSNMSLYSGLPPGAPGNLIYMGMASLTSCSGFACINNSVPLQIAYQLKLQNFTYGDPSHFTATGVMPDCATFRYFQLNFTKI